MLLGLDSTDSAQGGCTTHVAVEVWRALARFGAQGGPRLVRLNPNVPYKTRGNGALCLAVGHGVGRRKLAGVVRGVELFAYPRIEEPSIREAEEIFATAKDVVDRLRSPLSNTGLVVETLCPDLDDYRRAVTEHVDMVPSPTAAFQAAWGNGRGTLGARAATAWPAERGTFELIAYRSPERWGTPRNVDPAVGSELDARVVGSFDNWDPVHGHLRVAPSSPCPILFGVRGSDAAALAAAPDVIDQEPVDGWMTFMTNQASGDHLRRTTLHDVRPFDSVAAEAVVDADPETRRGGHVFVRLQGRTKRVVAAAYEPTKEFRDDVRSLRDGDRVLIEAAAHENAEVLALEALTVLDGSAVSESEPSCDCRDSASKGRRSPQTCVHCGRPFRVLPNERAAGRRVTVPVCVRRHLSTPPGFDEARLRLPAGGIAA